MTRKLKTTAFNLTNRSSVHDTELRPADVVDGFKTVYKTPKVGVDFTTLVDKISMLDPEMRIRFTSPHPKDFPDSVFDPLKRLLILKLLHLIAERHNICKSIHVPVQSGSSAVLERMRRGYSREAYLDLITRAREIVPGISLYLTKLNTQGISLSSDFISGFCGETEEEHADTVSLMKIVQYDEAFMFAYSEREKTPAHRRLKYYMP